MAYVDGFLIPLPARNLAAYKRMAAAAGKIWMEHGALEYRECVGDDLAIPMGTPFPKVAGMRRGESLLFSWIVYRSRTHRDRVNARVMKDPRIQKMMRGKGKSMPFDAKRMSYGGFKALVDLVGTR